MKRYIVIVILFSGCIHDKVSEEKIRVVNNSKRRISLTHSRLFPDTSLSEGFDSGCNLIDSTSFCDATVRLGWSLEFDRNPQKVLSLIISDFDTVKKYGADTWRNEYLILKRYDLTKDSLIKLNWTIIYP
jgi:hypothetical protein